MIIFIDLCMIAFPDSIAFFVSFSFFVGFSTFLFAEKFVNAFNTSLCCFLYLSTYFLFNSLYLSRFSGLLIFSFLYVVLYSAAFSLFASLYAASLAAFSFFDMISSLSLFVLLIVLLSISPPSFYKYTT